MLAKYSQLGDTPWKEYPVKHGRIIEKLVVTVISAEPSHRKIVPRLLRHRMLQTSLSHLTKSFVKTISAVLLPDKSHNVSFSYPVSSCNSLDDYETEHIDKH